MANPYSFSETLRFFGRWVRDPFLIGAVAPSSIGLSRGMAKPIDLEAPGVVIELGGGTGKMTKAMLDHGVPPDRLYVIEKDPDLHRLLTSRFPDVTIVNSDAAQVADVAASHGLDTVKAVVSGLPLIGMPFPVRQAIVGQVFQVLAPRGIFVQFTYMLKSPVNEQLMAEFGLVGRWVERIWRNMPPARVWVYRRKAEAA